MGRYTVIVGALFALLLDSAITSGQIVEFTSDTETPTMVDLEGDASVEVITIGRYATGSPMGLRIFDSASGALEFEWYPNPADGYYNLTLDFPFSIQDPDRDGQTDVIIAGDAFDNGSYVRSWHWFEGLSHKLSVTSTSSGAKIPVLAQTDGDSSIEMILLQGAVTGGAERLVVFDGDTGAQDMAWSPSNGQGLLSFIVRDIDSDARNEILVTGTEPGNFHTYRHYLIQTNGVPVIVAQPGTDIGLAIGTPLPSPSSAGAQFSLSLNESSPVTIRVVDVAGRIVATVLDGAVLAAGTQTIAWEGRGVNDELAPSGVYFAEVTAGGMTEVRRIVIVR